jgi:hypothetical protein
LATKTGTPVLVFSFRWLRIPKDPKNACQKNSTNRLKSATDAGFITKFKKQETGKIIEIAPWLTSLVAENQSKR